MIRGPSARVCVIGAGPSGIAAAKNLIEAGIKDVVVYEKGDRVGGNWLYSETPGAHSSVYETTFAISSKTKSQFDGFPMPGDYPDYPSHAQIARYFQDYAEHYGLLPYIRFNTNVAHAEPLPGDRWSIELADGSSEEFDYLVVANGHHSKPRLPEFRGSFAGEIIHSHDYKRAAPFTGKRVLIVGGGNSACDIAVETSRVSQTTALSLRRGYYFWPKFVLGKPTDVINGIDAFLPKWFASQVARAINYLHVGSYKHYGLESPKHGPYEQHPIINSELLYYIRHGRVQPRGPVDHFDGDKVHFADGLVEAYDVIIACTGYEISVPFLDSGIADYREGDVPLYLRVFHPRHPSLLFVGLIQPQGCLWTLSDRQSRLVSQYVLGKYDLPVNLDSLIAADVREIRRSYFKASRHTIEVDYYRYERQIKRALALAH